eukprot:g4047.t1
MADLILRDRGGIIWRKRPLLESSGRIVSIKNRKIEGKRCRVRFACIGISRGGTYGATADEKGRVYLFYFEKNQYFQIRNPGRRISSVVFSTTSPITLYVGLVDGHVLCYDVASCAYDTQDSCFGTLHAHKSAVLSVTPHPCRSRFVTISSDGATLWDAKDLESQSCLDGAESQIVAATYYRGRNAAAEVVLLLAFDDGSIVGWNDELDLKLSLSPPPDEVMCPSEMTVCDTTDRLLVAGQFGVIHVWDISKETLLHVVRTGAADSKVSNLHFFPNGRAFSYLDHEDGSVVVVSTLPSDRPYRILHALSIAKRAVTNFAMEGRSGQYLFLSATGGEARLYDIYTSLQSAADLRKLRVERLRFKTNVVDKYLFARMPGESAPLWTEDGGAGETEMKKKKKRTGGTKTENSEDDSRDSADSSDDGGDDVEEKNVVASRMDLGTTTDIVTTAALVTTTTPPTSARTNARSSTKRLAARDAKRPLREGQLRTLLLQAGSYPERLRLFAWKWVLDLPNNAEAFDALTRRGRHNSLNDFERVYPIRDSRIKRRLLHLLSAVGHWSPVLAKRVDFLPAMAFPFAKICGSDPRFAFEILATVVMHWCPRFFVNLPHLPLEHLSVVDKVLEFHDAELWLHLRRSGVGVQTWAWQPLQSLFAEVLPTHCFVQLWDHLFTFWKTPELLSIATVAFAMHCRVDLLTLSKRDGDPDEIFREHRHDLSQTHLAMTSFCRAVRRLHASTPKRLIRAIRFGSEEVEESDGDVVLLPLKRSGAKYPTFRCEASSDGSLEATTRSDWAISEPAVANARETLQREMEVYRSDCVRVREKLAEKRGVGS